jgi:hypothetical protein
MTRSDLYELVWKEPMVHAAKRFGISDVALRKTCVKHGIPTPPLGYWAKLAHGKRVVRPPLPALKGSHRNDIDLRVRPKPELPAAVSVALTAAQERAAMPENRVVVPAQRLLALHPTVAATEKAFRKARPDQEGFSQVSNAGCFNMSIAPASCERALLILDTLAKALEARGHTLRADSRCVHVIVEGEPLVPKIYETKSKRAYEPTAADLKKQASYDEDSRRYPTLYPPGEKVWQRSWTYFPSGRLCLEVSDPSRYSWQNEHLIGRWYDRKTKTLEAYLGEVIIALSPAAVLIKHRRAEEEEQARIRAEEAERRRREEARRQRAAKRHEFLLKKAETYAKYMALLKFCNFLEAEIGSSLNEPADRLASILRSLVEAERQKFDRSVLNSEAAVLGLFSDDDEQL